MHTLSHANTQTTRQINRAESFPCLHCGLVFSYEDVLFLHIITNHKNHPVISTRCTLPPARTSLLPSKNRLPLDLRTKPSGESRKRNLEESLAALPKPKKIWSSNIFLEPEYNIRDEQTIAESDLSSIQRSFSRQSTSSDITEKICKTEPRSPSPECISTENGRFTKSIFIPNNQADLIDCQKHFSRESESNQSVSRATANVKNSRFEAVQTALIKNADNLYICAHCNIIFLDRAMFHLHSGLHNCNSPLQCNICGKSCANALEFSAHIIHT